MSARRGEPSIEFYYSEISRQVEREDSLINNRLNWFLTSAGLLFAAFAVTVSSESEALSHARHALVLSVLFILPILGFIVSYCALVSVRAAERALNQLKKAWAEHVNSFFKDIEGDAHDGTCDDHRYFPRPYGDEIAWIGGHHFNRALPLFTGLTWLGLLQSSSMFILKIELYQASVRYRELLLGISQAGLLVFSLAGVACLVLCSGNDSKPQDFVGMKRCLSFSLASSIFGLVPAVDSSPISKVLAPGVALILGSMLLFYSILVALYVQAWPKLKPYVEKLYGDIATYR